MAIHRELKFVPIPYVEYFMANYNEGYTYGMRDGKERNSFVTNFSQEKQGFMTGYLHGYLHVTEKLRGASILKDVKEDFHKGIEDGNIVPEIDRKGSSPEEVEEYYERCKQRANRRKLKESSWK